MSCIEDAERYAASWYGRNVGSGSLTNSAASLSTDITFEAFGQLWTSGELAKRFPDHIKTKRSARNDDRRLQLYVYPAIGTQRLSRFEGKAGLDLVEKVMAGLPPVGRTFSRGSRRHILQSVHRLLVLATYPARLISVNPLPKGFLPRASSNRAKSFLYPAEDAALLACKNVPLVERLFFGLLAREGLRSAELLNLQWTDVDLDRGVLVLDRNKTNDPRSWSMDAGVVCGLKVWKAKFARSAKPNAKIIEDKNGAGIDRYMAASNLRDYLKLAGIERPQLFESNDQRIALRAHDLRATFVTVSLANGRTEAWVCDRTGHRSSQMLYSYRRQARMYAELNLGELTPLDQALPELLAAAAEMGE
ncbi:MAG: tyrosine-type recombinase/integrase [Pseudomonadota bacterium]